MPLNESQGAQSVVLAQEGYTQRQLAERFQTRSQVCIEFFKGMRRQEHTLDELDKVAKENVEMRRSLFVFTS
jgi:hypothetical protein